jgi:nucleotide-binding universal stress UspA family protein
MAVSPTPGRPVVAAANPTTATERRGGLRPSRTVSSGVRRRGTFDRIVVPVGVDDALSVRAVEAAARISSESATVVLVSVLEVPRELPLDALFPDEETAARAALRHAAAIAEAHGVHVVPRLERGYSAAPAVLELAEHYAADLIVLGTANRSRRGRSVFGPTATAILHRATCRVLLVTR